MSIPPNERPRRPRLTETLTLDQQDELSEIDSLLLGKTPGWKTLDPDLQQASLDELHAQERELLANREANEIIQKIAKQLGSVCALALARTVIQVQPEAFRRLALLQRLQQRIERHIQSIISVPNLAELSDNVTAANLTQQIRNQTGMFLPTGEVNFSILESFVIRANEQVMGSNLSAS